MKVNATGLVLSPSQKLTGVRKEPHAKRRSEHPVAYVVVDKLGEWTLLGQKLQLIAAYINERIADESFERVSTNGLWSNLDRNDGRVGGWHKGRWRINAVELDRASDAFESKRVASGKSAIVAAEPSCYAIGT